MKKVMEMEMHLEHAFDPQFPTSTSVDNESTNISCWGYMPDSSVGTISTCPTQQPSSTKSSFLTNYRTHARLAKTSVLFMERWLATHVHSPYPTEEDKNKIKQQTGLTLSQISSWFSNARKRGKAKVAPRPAPLNDISSPYTESEFPDLHTLHPFDRWLRLGPEHETASLDCINGALKSLGHIKPVCLPDSRARCRGGQWQFSHRHGSSISSLDIRSYGSEIPELPLPEYAQSASSTVTKCEQRRRKGTKSMASLPEISRRFCCTFCPKTFRTKHDWQRHEKSQHLALEIWTCTLHGNGVDVDPHTNKITCTFCNIDDPSPEHLQTHHFTACITRPISERIFLRKDHLCQHLKLTHGNCVFRDSMRAWKTSRDHVCSRCGFCDAHFETWSSRIKHLVKHFNEGKTMSDWKGDWGLDEDVSGILENATLPEKYGIKPSSTLSVAESTTESCQRWNFCREGTYFENSLSPASTWLSSEPYQPILENTPTLFTDALLFDEESGDLQQCFEDWGNNLQFSTDSFAGFSPDPMDSWFDFEHATKPDLPIVSNMLACHYNCNYTESDL